MQLKKENFLKRNVKRFKAYVFGLRSGVTYKPAPGWDIKDEDKKKWNYYLIYLMKLIFLMLYKMV